MVLKKNLLKELRNSNKELEKYFSNIDLDNISNEKISSSRNNDDDFLNVIGTGILDLRTEVSFLRKNLSNDVEAMVMKTIQNSQQQFSKQINQVYSKLLLDLKSNFSGYISEINEEFSIMKKEFNKMVLKDELVDNSLSNFRDEVLKLNSQISKLDKNSNKKIEEKIDSLMKYFLEINESLTKKNIFLESNLLGVNKKLVNVESSFKDFDNLIKTEQFDLNKKINTINTNINLKMKTFESSFEDFTISQNKKDKKVLGISDSLNLIQNEQKNLSKNINLVNGKVSSKFEDFEKLLEKRRKFNKIEIRNNKQNLEKNKIIPIPIDEKPLNDDSNTIDRILKIDKRLEKLNSLRN